jgi:hypothetical protein
MISPRRRLFLLFALTLTALLIVLALVTRTPRQETLPAESRLAAPAGADLDRVDKGLVAQLVSRKGLSYTGAYYIAMSKIEYRKIGDRQYVFTVTYPTGNRAEVTFTLEPATVTSIAWSPQVSGVRRSWRVNNHVFTYEIGFSTVVSPAVPGQAPPSVFRPPHPSPMLRNASMGSLLVAAQTTAPAPELQVFQGTVSVRMVVDGVQSQAISQFYDYIRGKVLEVAPEGEAIGRGFQAYDAVTKFVPGVFELKSRHEAYTKELDRLQKCVELPLDPLAQLQYAQDPSLKAKHLEEIRAAREDIAADSTARYVLLGVDTASGLLEVGNPLAQGIVGGTIGVEIGLWDRLLQDTSETSVLLIRNQVRCAQEARPSASAAVTCTLELQESREGTPINKKDWTGKFDYEICIENELRYFIRATYSFAILDLPHPLAPGMSRVQGSARVTVSIDGIDKACGPFSGSEQSALRVSGSAGGGMAILEFDNPSFRTPPVTYTNPPPGRDCRGVPSALFSVPPFALPSWHLRSGQRTVQQLPLGVPHVRAVRIDELH